MTNFGNREAPGRTEICKEVVPKFRVKGPEKLLDHLVPLRQVEVFLTELAKLVIHARSLRKQQEQLAANMTNAKPVWESRGGEKKYLRLVHPTEGGTRKREYIGNKEHKVKEALQRVENYETFCKVKEELQEVEWKINLARTRWLTLLAGLDRPVS